MKPSEALRRGSAGREQIQGQLFGDRPRTGASQTNALPRLDDGTIDLSQLPEIKKCCALGAIAIACAEECSAPTEPERNGTPEGALLECGTGVKFEAFGHYAIGSIHPAHSLYSAIYNLNDSAHYSFEDIAAWLEARGL